ncbi:unnamed protein product [Prorocentrum cordatum]|uniref:Uncharacterized protein n=1 Tax=Prorocentrum cordatum TaxID=2364126 RepID=A0ABN9PQC0_9DINO|nr:unnamed protein product [Polarella glacialis]
MSRSAPRPQVASLGGRGSALRMGLVAPAGLRREGKGGGDEEEDEDEGEGALCTEAAPLGSQGARGARRAGPARGRLPARRRGPARREGPSAQKNNRPIGRDMRWRLKNSCSKAPKGPV